MQIRRTGVSINGGPGGAGLFVDRKNRVIVTKGTGTEFQTQSVVVTRQKEVVEKTAAFTVSLPDDDGKIFKLNAAAGITVTLPAISADNKGQSVTFVNAALPSSNDYRISPNAADSIKYGVVDKDLINTAGTDALGDLVTLVSDGADTWIVTEQVGTWAKEA